MTTAQHCQCIGCHKCDRQSGNYCRRSVVYDVDHLCEECHNHIYDARLDGGGGSFLRGGGTGRTPASFECLIAQILLNQLGIFYA